MALDDCSWPYLNQTARTEACLEHSEAGNLEKRATNLRDRLLLSPLPTVSPHGWSYLKARAAVTTKQNALTYLFP